MSGTGPASPGLQPDVRREFDERRRRHEQEQQRRAQDRWLAAKHAWQQQMEAARSAPSPEEFAASEDTVLVVDDGEPAGEPATAIPRLFSIDEILSAYEASGNRDAAMAQIRQLLADRPEMMADLAQAASRGNRDQQLLLAEGLAAVGTETAIQELMRLIQAASSGDARTDLVEAMAKATNTESAAFLLDTLLATSDEDLMQAAQRALGNMCDQSLFGEMVARYVHSQSEGERDNLLGAIRYISDPAAVPYLAELAALPNTDFDDPLALAVVDTLGIIGTPEAVQALFDLLAAVPTGQSLPILDSIERVSNPDSFDLLGQVARGRQSASIEARLAAMDALARLMSPPVEALLRELLRSDVQEIRAEAAILLGSDR